MSCTEHRVSVCQQTGLCPGYTCAQGTVFSQHVTVKQRVHLGLSAPLLACCRRTDIADALQRGAPTPADIARVAKAVYASPMNIQAISSCQPSVDTSSATDGPLGSQAYVLPCLMLIFCC